jgi:hypothetical protein
MAKYKHKSSKSDKKITAPGNSNQVSGGKLLLTAGLLMGPVVSGLD